jgi:hypothetical protein
VEFNLTPPHTTDYIAESVERAGKIISVFSDMKISIYWFSRENVKEPQKSSQNVYVERTTSHTEALVKARSKLFEYLAPRR